MRATRLLGLRKFFVQIHFSSCISAKKTENYSITSKTWYNFCGLRKFSLFNNEMSIENPMTGGAAESVSKINGNQIENETFLSYEICGIIAI